MLRTYQPPGYAVGILRRANFVSDIERIGGLHWSCTTIRGSLANLVDDVPKCIVIRMDMH